MLIKVSGLIVQWDKSRRSWAIPSSGASTRSIRAERSMIFEGDNARIRARSSRGISPGPVKRRMKRATTPKLVRPARASNLDQALTFQRCGETVGLGGFGDH